MRLGSVFFLVSLCLGLGAFEAGILKAVWENEAGYIDPWGKPTADDAGHIDPLGTPSTDEAGFIDPLGNSGR
jgi:hypothetical protein